MSFSPDHANYDYDPNYNTPDPKSSDIERRAASFKRKPPLSGKWREAAKAMKNEPSLDSRKSCTGMFCGAVQKLKFWGGKRRTKKRRKKRRTKSRRKTKRRRKSRRRTKRRRRKR